MNDGLLFLSIPYSEGWTAYVDGKEQEITPIGDAFIGLELDAGKHDIELKYSPEGFGTGLLISIGSLAVMAGLSVLFELLNRKGAAKDETVDQEDQKD